MKLRYNSSVVLTFAIVSFCVFLMPASVIEKIAILHPGFDYRNFLDYLTHLTYVFGHSSWAHLTSNFSIILLLGPILEEKYGSKSMFKMIMVTVFCTGILNTLFFSTGLLGASGVAFMFLVLASITNISKGEIPLTFLLIAAIFLTQEITSAISIKDNISQFAHIVGGLFGAFYGFKLNK